MTPPRTRNPDEEAVRRAAPGLTLPSITKAWRTHARVHGAPRPEHAQPLPPGLAAALSAPVVTQCLIQSHSAESALPVISGATVHEEPLLPVFPDEELSIHVTQEPSGSWIAECLQRDAVVARIRWEWAEKPR